MKLKLIDVSGATCRFTHYYARKWSGKPDPHDSLHERVTVQTCLKTQSAVRKKMATGTFTYSALRTKTLKERIKTQREIVSHSNSRHS